ncbi:MAG TPA: Ig-like domain-containing protein, partial [Polyangia bacterium]|nr:Ig-like domain-containing protein [Polyangia bacterium]
GYAVLNSTADPNDPIWAVNNWWGSSTGPTTGDLCNPNGGGDRVSSGVTYLPFLTQLGTDTGPVAPVDLFNLTLAPVRWYVPADGSSQAWVKIGLRDRLGQPVQGKNVTLGSSLGTVTGGAPTDINGEAFAYVVSDTPGTAALTAGLAAGDACQPYRPATSTITFTASDSNPLMPDSAAPYLSSDIEISPMPIVQGVTTTVRAHVKNPNNFPISVNADFSFAQLGIGLEFGPLGSVTGQTIAANAEGVLQITWVPAISGHYCIQLRYNGAPVPQSSALSSGSGDFSGEAQENLDAQPGCMRSSGEENTIDKAEKVMGWAHIGTVGLNAAEMGETLASEGLLGGPSPFLIPEIGAGFLTHWILEKGREIGNALAGVGDCTPGNSGSSGGSGDRGSGSGAPPGGYPGSSSGGYTQISKPVHIDFTPLPASSTVSQARADAYNQWVRAALDAFSDFAAMEAAEQASSDAAGAGDLDWQAQQNAAYILYQTQTGNALIALADATDSLLSVARREGVIYDVITVADAQTYLGLLQTKGFSDADKQAAKLLGFTDAQIEWFRQQILALRPEDLAGDRVAVWAAMSAAWREMGNALLAPPPIMASAALPSALVTSQGNLARIYGRTSSFVLGNPLTTTATINLQVRQVDLPRDWTVKLTPSSVTLAPGKQTKVLVDIQPGSSLAQGSKPRLAVEAYAQDQLLGGVVLDTLVPKYASITSACSGTGNIAQGATCACSMDCQSGLICGSTGAGASQCLVPCNLAAVPGTCPSGQTCSKWSGSGGLCTTGGGTAAASKKSSGCSCRVANSEGGTSMLLFSFIGLGFFFSRRRADRRGRSKK